MTIARTLACLSVLTLAATPVVSLAAEAEARRAAPVGVDEQLAGGTGLVTLLAFVAALGALVIIASDDDEDEPDSP